MLLEITALGKTTLLIVAGLFIAWALVTAIFIPKRNEDFPLNLNAYIAASAVLFFAQMGAVLWVTGTQEVESEEHGQVEGSGEATGTEPVETAPAETSPSTETGQAETSPPETETTGTEPVETESSAGATTGEAETEPEGAGGDPAAGKAVFASAGCESCHTLADAGSTGTVGPNLDDASPSADKVVERVTEGKGVMPSFQGQLSEQQIQDVAAYVSSVAGT